MTFKNYGIFMRKVSTLELLYRRSGAKMDMLARRTCRPSPRPGGNTAQRGGLAAFTDQLGTGVDEEKLGSNITDPRAGWPCRIISH